MTYHRKFLFGLLVLGLLSACTQTPEQRAKAATVLIITGNMDIGTGSGFFVRPDKIVTNIHVVDDARMVFVVGEKKFTTLKGSPDMLRNTIWLSCKSQVKVSHLN